MKQIKTLKKNKNGGFTFIEIIAVILIIVVLAAILTPKVFTFVEQAKQASALTGAENMLTSLRMYYIKSDDLSQIDAEKLNEYMSGVAATNVSTDSSGMPVIGEPILNTSTPLTLKDGQCAISAVTGDGDFTFTYYQNISGSMYSVNCVDGVVDSESVKKLN